MSDAWLIDTRRVAERGERFERQLTAAELPRLRKECTSRFEPVAVSVQGVFTPYGKPGVRVTMQAALRVPCQRCLKPLPVTLAPVCAFEWVTAEAELNLRDEDDEWDAVLAGEQFDLLPLLEDELLLALPFAPAHTGCKPGAAFEAGEKISPFAALAGLKALK